ncbi:MAG: hypothetical protein ABRQ30_03715 [Smithellaceae bacterium]|jgi:hypothetical protein
MKKEYVSQEDIGMMILRKGKKQCKSANKIEGKGRQAEPSAPFLKNI